MRDRRYFCALIFFDLVNHHHTGNWMCLLEIIAHALFQDGGRKWAKGLAFLDPRVENIFHLGATRVNNDAAIPQRPWPKLHLSLKPANDISIRDSLRSYPGYFLIFQDTVT